MSEFALSILEDYDHDAPIADEAFGDDINRLNTDMTEIATLEKEISSLHAISKTVFFHGIDAGSVMMLRGTGLLTSTALASIGCESANENDLLLNDQVALEAINESMKEKVAKWSAKILSVVKDSASNLINIIEPLYKKVEDHVKSLTQKTWDAAKTTTTIVKAHPYKTILTALGAAIAIGGVLLFVSRSGPDVFCTNGQMTSFTSKVGDMLRKISLPFGKVRTTTALDGAVTLGEIAASEMPAVPTDRLAALGWTRESVATVGRMTSTMFNSVTSGVKSLGGKVAKPIRTILSSTKILPSEIGSVVTKTTNTPIAGWATQKIVEVLYLRIMWSMLNNLLSLAGKIVGSTLQMIRGTLGSLNRNVPTEA